MIDHLDSFAALVDLMDRDFLSKADHDRLGRLAKLVAHEQGVCVDAVFQVARELLTEISA